MKIMAFCPLWGHEQLPLTEFIPRVAEAGFDGLDSWLPDDPKQNELLFKLLEKHKLSLLAHQHQASGKTPAEFHRSFREQLIRCAETRPFLINSHTGRDWFSFEENCRLLETAKAVSEEYGIQIAHETHRGRFSYSPMATRPYLERYPKLSLTADFSHWCNVTESLLENHQATLELACARAVHFHARVGYAEGPQVPDPRAPEWQTALDAHLRFWDTIMNYQISRGAPVFSFTTEFGPPPYMPTLPFKNEPVASQWEINCYMLELLRNRYESQLALG